MEIEVESTELSGEVPYQGSKIGDEANLLQNEPLTLGGERFALQFYGGRFPKPYNGIFGLSDAVAYLFIDQNRTSPSPSSDAGTFFVQVT